MHMNYITTTQLRTKSTKLIEELRNNNSVSPVHRSIVVGLIQPAQPEGKPFDVESFKKLIKKLNLPKTTYAQRERIYRSHLMKKYGRGLSRH